MLSDFWRFFPGILLAEIHLRVEIIFGHVSGEWLDDLFVVVVVGASWGGEGIVVCCYFSSCFQYKRSWRKKVLAAEGPLERLNC